LSGSGSAADPDSTYDAVTRQTAFNVIDSARTRLRLPGAPPMPILFISHSAVAWPNTDMGKRFQGMLPAWLKEYLTAKKAVEDKISSNAETIRGLSSDLR